MSLLSNKKTKLSDFERLAIPYLDFIYRSAYRLSGNSYDAEDLSQETFRMAFEKFEQLKDIAKIKSWLFMILRNCYFQQIKKQKRYVDIDIDLVNYNPREVQNSGKEFMNHVLSENIQRALDKLSEKYKTPVILSYMGGYSYQEIADMLQIPIGTVMSRIARGKAFLKKEILSTAKQKVNKKK